MVKTIVLMNGIIGRKNTTPKLRISFIYRYKCMWGWWKL